MFQFSSPILFNISFAVFNSEKKSFWTNMNEKLVKTRFAVKSDEPILLSHKQLRLLSYSHHSSTTSQIYEISKIAIHKGRKISKAIFLETPLPKKRPKFFEGFLP